MNEHLSNALDRLHISEDHQQSAISHLRQAIYHVVDFLRESEVVQTQDAAPSVSSESSRFTPILGITQANDLYLAIEHGDDEHRKWLYEAIHAWSNYEPVPPPRTKAPTPEPTQQDARDAEDFWVQLSEQEKEWAIEAVDALRPTQQDGAQSASAERELLTDLLPHIKVAWLPTPLEHRLLAFIDSLPHNEAVR